VKYRTYKLYHGLRWYTYCRDVPPERLYDGYLIDIDRIQLCVVHNPWREVALLRLYTNMDLNLSVASTGNIEAIAIIETSLRAILNNV
jgi:hypothetical protein